jgi:DNA/RNA endonuclease YhcR with UshA esterase domain
MKRIYTIFTLLLLLVCLNTEASAQLLIEPFNYTTSATDGLAKQSSGAWFNVNSGDSVLIDAGSLNYTGYPTSTGNKIKFDGAGVDLQKTFTAQTSGTVYYSFLLRCTSLTGVTSTTGSYFTGFRGGTTSSFGGCIWVKNNGGTGYFIGISPRSSGGTPAQTFTSTSFPLDSTILIVASIQIVSGTTNDSVKLWINPSAASFTSSEPVPDLAILNNSTNGDLSSVDGIFIRQDAIVGTPFLQMDEMRVGTVWSKVMTGVIEPTANFSKKTISFGKVNVGVSVYDTVTVTNSGFDTLKISSVTSGSGVVVVDPLNETILMGASKKFSVKYTPTAATPTTSNILFASNAPSSLDTVKISGEGVQAGFSASVSTIKYGNVWKDSVKTDSVIISNISTTLHLIVDSVRSSNGIVTVSPTTADIDTSAKKTFIITYKPTAKGALSGAIVFYSNAPSKNDTIKVSGNCILKEPLFSATPASLKFGGVLSGKTKKDSVTIKNIGYDSLFITAITSSNTVFTVTPSAARLDSGASQKFYVIFAPTGIGPQSTSLVFTTNTSEVNDTVKAIGSGITAVTIAEARIDANNDLVPDHSVTKDTIAVYGVITTPSFSGTQTSYFIQDATAGINIFSYTPSETAFAIGDSVLVIGYVAQYRGLTEFTPLTVDASNFSVVKKNAIVPKVKRLTLKDFVKNSENYEGQLIELDSLIKASGTWPAAGVNASVYLTNLSKSDTVQMFLDADTKLGGITEPIYPINVVGVVSQYSSGSTVLNNGYEIVPRDTNDFSKTKITPIVTIAEARKDANNDLIADHSVLKDTMIVYGVITTPSFSGTQTSYFIQDATAGINIFSYTPSATAFVIGDSVMVMGYVAQYRGLTEFTPLTVDAPNFGVVKKNAVVPKAKRLTLKDFAKNAESYEGQLIELDSLFKASGTWPASGNASVYLMNLSKSDTVQMFLDVDVKIAGTPEPLYPINVVGVVSQYSSASTVYNNGYEIVPRDTNDIKHIIINGVNDKFSGIPAQYELYNNYPNPFNPTTMIKFGLPVVSNVSLKIYDALGREIATLVNEQLAAGYHDYQWNAGSLASGVYFYRITATSTNNDQKQAFTQVNKLLLMK